jgi:hypothetical protein
MKMAARGASRMCRRAVSTHFIKPLGKPSNLSSSPRDMRSPGVNGELAHPYCLCLERQVGGSTR